jgi:hypothetical protein
MQYSQQGLPALKPSIVHPGVDAVQLQLPGAFTALLGGM